MTKSLKNGEYDYKQTDFLGEGSFAKVYRGIIVKTQRVIAVRLLPLKLIKQYGNKIKAIINGEVTVLKELSENPDVDCLFTTKIYDCFLTEHNVVMILEFCPDGNLEDVVADRGPIAEQEALQIAYQLARGLQFISKRKVVHRDIKPDNIFIKKQGGLSIYKIGDFGFAVKKQINDQIVGTPIFMSPELFREEKYGSEVDVWAYGLLVHYLLFREHYFMENTESKVKAKVLGTRYNLSQKQKSMISPKTGQFLADCLQFQKQKRLHAQDLASHPVFDGVKAKVQGQMKQMQTINEMTESQLRKETVKGRYISFIMSHNFIKDIAISLARIQNNNLATLYLLKYCFAEISALKNLLINRVNVINHGEWGAFVQTPEFANSFKIIDNLIATTQKAFETYYSTVINLIAQQYPQAVQGITSNLGNGPLAKISPQIPIYELKNNWITKLGNSTEEYLIKIQILVVMALLEKKQVAIDFYAFEMTKKTASNQEIVDMFEKALKECS